MQPTKWNGPPNVPGLCPRAVHGRIAKASVHNSRNDFWMQSINLQARALVLVLWLVFLAQPVVTDQRAHTCLRFSLTHPQQYMPGWRAISEGHGQTQPVDGNITIGKPGPHFGPLLLQLLLGVCRRAPFVLGVGL